MNFSDDKKYNSESRLSKDTVDLLNKMANTVCYKRTASYNNAGQADISGCSHGIRFEIEGKIEGENLRPLQSFWQKEWKKAGAIVGRYESPIQAKKIILEGLSKRKLRYGGVGNERYFKDDVV